VTGTVALCTAMNTSLRVGDLIDRFRIDSLVSNTPTTALFRATDTCTGATVAVKVPHSNRTFWSFRREDMEAELTMDLAHPGIVRVVSVRDKNPRCTVMEWVDGRSLRQVICEEATLPIERTLRIIAAICTVLEYVHDQGAIHLDVKPENVILTWNEEVKLIDFGLARRLKSGPLRLLAWSAAGTPDYASPEQIRRKPVDVRSDIYSLGLVFYEMLTGDLPFSGTGAGTSIQLRMATDALPPSEVNSEISSELDGIVCRAISRDSRRRQACVHELRTQLEEVRNAIDHELVASI
jgi:serine/threonine protein kinase